MTFLTRAKVIVPACAAVLLAGCGVLLTPKYRLERAQREIRAGQWQAAAIDLRIVVKKEPRNAQAWLLLAQLSFDAADPQGAESSLKHAVVAGAKGPLVDELRARIWLQTGQAQRLLDAVAHRGIALPDPEGTIATARALLATRQPAAALAKLQPLLAARPDLVEARDVAAESLAGQSRLGAALQQLDQAMQQDPKAAEPPLLKGLILQQQGQFASAQDALELALKLMSPAEPIVHRVRALIALTEVRLALGHIGAAAASEAAVAKLEPQSPATALLDARLKIAHKDLEGAVAELEQVLVAAPGFNEARTVLGATLMQRGDLQQAQQQLADVVQSAPDDLAARKLLAQVRLKLGQPEQALSVLSPALSTDVLDPQLLSLYGDAATRAGDKGALIEALQRSEHERPTDTAVLLNLTAAYLAAGHAGQALSTIQKTTDDGDLRRERLLIATLTAAKGPEAAAAEVERLVAAHPRAPGILDLAASYYMSQGRTKDARAALHTALSLNPHDLSSQVALARIEEGSGDLKGAQHRLEAVLKAHPTALPVRLTLADLMVRAKAYDGARALLDAAGPHAGPEVKFALARVALARGDLKAANAALDQAIAEQPGQASMIEDAGLLLMSANQFDAALARFAQATQLAPKDAGYWLNSARAQLALNQPVAARSSLDRAEELDPSSLPVISTLAYLDLRQGNGQAALARVKSRLLQHPLDPGLLQLEGDVESALHEPAAAEAAYGKAQQQRPSARLAANLYRERLIAHAAEPQRPLEQWLARQPQSWPIRDLLGEYYLGIGNSPQRAAQEFKSVIAQQPHDVVALNNLAWALNQMSDPGALRIAQRAYQLAPSLSSVNDTLGWVLVREGKAGDAVAYLRRAAKLDPKDPDVEYHLAYALAKTGQPAEARQILARILSTRQPFGSRADAQHLLTSVKG